MTLLLFVLLALGSVGTWGATAALGCGPGERAVFAAFPRYGGRMPEPRFNVELGWCFAWFVTRDTRGEVFAYYTRELRERGWEVKPPGWSLEPVTSEARRRGYGYAVIYEAYVSQMVGA